MAAGRLRAGAPATQVRVSRSGGPALVEPSAPLAGKEPLVSDGVTSTSSRSSAVAAEIPVRALLEARGIRKAYGPTLAANDVDLRVERAEVVGLVGANGAGKSVMMRVLSGVTRPDRGELLLGGEPVRWSAYDPLAAKGLGVRIVFQELSLCTNLRVYENFYLERAHLFRRRWRWRAPARELARRSLDEVFPRSGIDVDTRVALLPIAQQQMVEIARAVSDPETHLFILDEPTSSLPREQTQQLLSYMGRARERGASFIFISHRLNEVLSSADRIYVMQNGSVKWTGPACATGEEDLVARMGEGQGARAEVAGGEQLDLAAALPASPQGVGVRIAGLSGGGLHGIDCDLAGGQIVGIAGLDGSGQRELLQAIFQPGKARRHLRRTGRVAYVTGDRKTEGTFGLWSVARNMVIGKLARGRLFAGTGRKRLEPAMQTWYQQLRVKGTGLDGRIVDLSGGNQQKVLIARALISEADIVLLDDPTRGVDIATKRLLYRILQEAAARGKLIVWYSTEDEEFSYCSSVLVMHGGQVVRTLDHREATRDAIVNAAFSRQGEKTTRRMVSIKNRLDMTGLVIPLAVMLGFFGLCGLMQRNVFSAFGVELLLSGGLPLVFATLAQAFVIGMSHVDIGVGNYMGLINVLCATLLLQSPLLGVLALATCVATYSFMGFLIHWRRLPSIVVTLGFSFIWTGVAYSIQLQPGGRAPAWLTAAYGVQLPLLPRSVYLVGAIAALAFLVHRSRYGTVLRGFGNNPQSMRRSGWSETVAYSASYLVSGVIGLLGGLLVTAITTASDANAVSSYTLLSVASVVIGGGFLSGGVVSPFGAVFGAITVSLISTLMGFFDISSSYVMAVQGGILLVVLALRLLRREKER
jgi:ribose transport system ATP-binding protein